MYDEIIKALKAILENPEDLAQVPTIITQLEEHQTTQATQEADYQDRINKQQQAYRNLLAQVPVTTGESEPPKDETPTFEDAQAELQKIMQNMGGN